MSDSLASAASSLLAAASALSRKTALRLLGNGKAGWGDSSTNNTVNVSSDGEVYTTETERERNVWAGYGETGINSTRYAILIDLSDTTNWKHDQTGRIDLSVVRMQVDKASSTTGQVQLGVITAIDGTQATIKYFYGILFDNSSDDHINRDMNFAPSQIKLGVSGGNLTRGISSGGETTASVNTAGTLNSPRGASTVTPAVGDVIIKMTRTTGTFSMGTLCLYHAESST